MAKMNMSRLEYILSLKSQLWFDEVYSMWENWYGKADNYSKSNFGEWLEEDMRDEDKEIFQ